MILCSIPSWFQLTIWQWCNCEKSAKCCEVREWFWMVGDLHSDKRVQGGSQNLECGDASGTPCYCQNFKQWWKKPPASTNATSTGHRVFHKQALQAGWRFWFNRWLSQPSNGNEKKTFRWGTRHQAAQWPSPRTNWLSETQLQLQSSTWIRQHPEITATYSQSLAQQELAQLARNTQGVSTSQY